MEAQSDCAFAEKSEVSCRSDLSLLPAGLCTDGAAHCPVRGIELSGQGVRGHRVGRPGFVFIAPLFSYATVKWVLVPGTVPANRHAQVTRRRMTRRL